MIEGGAIPTPFSCIPSLEVIIEPPNDERPHHELKDLRLGTRAEGPFAPPSLAVPHCPTGFKAKEPFAASGTHNIFSILAIRSYLIVQEEQMPLELRRTR